MSRLIIRNIGPIDDIDISLNKVNIFIGPQSSGKSTIAKIISFCSWLEKAFYRFDMFKNGFPAYKRLQSYHHMESYFNSDSVIYYCGDNLIYAYQWPSEQPIPCPWSDTNTERYDEHEFFITPSKQIISPKVVYIPAERNFVSTVPNLRNYAEEDDNLMDFVISWLNIKRKYTSDNKLELLNLDVKYYSPDGNIDKLELYNDRSITLQSASSGLQSVVPLLSIVNWLADGIYTENKPFSYDEQEKISNILDGIDNTFSDSEKLKLKERLSAFLRGKIYTHTQFIIEEPEQNLFPDTQCELMYYLLKKINHGREHRLVVTTHSPYILYAVSNCSLLGKIKENLPESITSHVACRDSWINPEKLSVWQIRSGHLENIIDNRTCTISKHYFNDIMNDTLDDYYRMIPYLDL